MLRIVLPFILRINGVYAAKTIEDADPAFKNSLVNYLTLRTHRDRLPKAVLATLEARAVSDLAHVEVEQVVNQHRLMKAFYTLCGVVVVFCLYAAFAPKSILDSARRAFLADVVRPTNTRLLNIKPGDSEVVAGDAGHLLGGHQPWRPPREGQASLQRGRRQVLRRQGVRARHQLLRPVAADGQQRPADHGLLPDRRRRRVAALHAQGAPRADGDRGLRSITSSPTTRRIPARKGIEGGSVEAIEGTKVTVHATTNEPAERGTLNLTTGDLAPMTVEEGDAHQLIGKFKVTKSGTYTINFRTTGGPAQPQPGRLRHPRDRRPTAPGTVPQPRPPDREGPGERQGRPDR